MNFFFTANSLATYHDVYEWKEGNWILVTGAGVPEVSPLIGGQNTQVGDVTIWNTDEDLHVQYQTYSPWYMTETHLYVGEELPSSAAPGKFPYKYENSGGFNQYTYIIPLADLDVEPGDWLYILAHAVVINAETGKSETAWKEGTDFGRNGWAMYNEYQVQFRKAKLRSENPDFKQYRFSSSRLAGTSGYFNPKVGNPGQFLIRNVVNYYGHSNNPGNPDSGFNDPDPPDNPRNNSTAGGLWIRAWISETELFWDVFKPGSYMGKVFTIGVESNGPVQILLGSGTIQIPYFDPATGNIAWWGPWQQPSTTSENIVEDKKRIKSLLGDKNNRGTPPDNINICYWWYESSEMPDPIEWDQAKESVPSEDNVGIAPDQWKRASDMNGQVLFIRDGYEEGRYLTFFENIKVERSDSEGEYIEQFSICIAPSL
ncbi:MAG TPA: hypothetical protein ENL43_02630 [candidate division WOR-3 bacterium]|uniref:Uncharacterized protein n=1 Tax=candidate division WOR-3 bacterium TaxID=2052148 RepID=A0A7V5HMZ2_UNCW3|nr:hypothetical protein [candidate division WOR-3 bacterium]